MAPLRTRAGLLGSILCLFLLAILIPQAVPTPSHASRDGLEIGRGGPRDPGTPYDEPEGGGTGPSDPELPQGIQGEQNGISPADSANEAPAPSALPATGARLSSGRSLLWRILFFMRIGG